MVGMALAGLGSVLEFGVVVLVVVVLCSVQSGQRDQGDESRKGPGFVGEELGLVVEVHMIQSKR